MNSRFAQQHNSAPSRCGFSPDERRQSTCDTVEIVCLRARNKKRSLGTGDVSGKNELEP